MNVVGTMFFKDNKLLIDKPRKRPTYQMIGGKIEDGESPKWYTSKDGTDILSNTLKNEVIPYCKKNNLID